MSTLRQLLRKIARIGADPSDDDDLRLQKTILTTSVAVSAVLLVMWGTLLGLGGEPEVGWLNIGWGIFQAASLMLFAMRRAVHPFARSQSLALLFVPFVETLMLGGFKNANGLILWGLIAPLGILLMYDVRTALRWFISYLTLVGISLVLEPYLRASTNFSPLAARLLLGINLVCVLSFVFAILAYFVGQRNLAYRLLRGEQEKAEHLLLNILPKEIAAILKNENRIIADHFDGASILFADVVNFTPLSAQMSAVELVELLNEVFSHFDTLVERDGLEKIKTIGDSYMVAAGVPRPRADHAHALARLALQIQAYMQTHTFRGGRRLTLRIGINSGPVVAGVIGRKKFIYDLWGDAVNTASRMESHGASGAIQITRATYELIKDDFDCRPMGTVPVKGKGEMEIWHVVGTRADREAQQAPARRADQAA